MTRESASGDGALVEVRIEIARGSHLKRDHLGRVELLSPVPCPYNYGSVVGTIAADGDPQDAIVLGPSVRRGTTLRLPRRGVVRFVDEGVVDDKWILSTRPVTPKDRLLLAAFFRLYSVVKRIADRARGNPGPTRFLGVIEE